MTPVESTALSACPNCGAAIVGKYCPSCGQRNDRLRLSSGAMVKDFLETVLKVDKKLLATLRSLLLPGQLTIDYLEGRRARYPRPLSIFFICAGLYFVAWSQASHDVVKEGLKLGQATFKFSEEETRGAVQDDGFFARVLRHPERLQRLASDLQSPRGQFLQVFALAIALVATTRRRGLLWSEQLVFSLHLQAVSSLVMAVVYVVGARPDLGYGLGSVYDLIAFARLYQFGWWGSLWRYGLTLALVGLVGTVLAVPLFFIYSLQ
jgi:Protein of unknown function (DUF3667)